MKCDNRRADFETIQGRLHCLPFSTFSSRTRDATPNCRKRSMPPTLLRTKSRRAPPQFIPGPRLKTCRISMPASERPCVSIQLSGSLRTEWSPKEDWLSEVIGSPKVQTSVCFHPYFIAGRRYLAKTPTRTGPNDGFPPTKRRRTK